MGRSLADSYREMNGVNLPMVDEAAEASVKPQRPAAKNVGPDGMPLLPSQLDEATGGSMHTPICPRCGGRLTVIHKAVRASIVMFTCPSCNALLSCHEKR